MFFTKADLNNKLLLDPARDLLQLQKLTKDRPITVSYLNAHVLALLFFSRTFRKIFTQIDYVYPDGWGAVLYLRLLGVSVTQRQTAPDFIWRMLAQIEKKQLATFLIGGQTRTLLRLAKKLLKRYPQIKLIGLQHGYFQDSQKVSSDILIRKPKLILVGMGADKFWQLPKQEQWVIRHLHELRFPSVVWCVGDLYTQLLQARKPKNWYTEWWQRIKNNPQKMLARYVFDAVGLVLIIIGVFWNKCNSHLLK